LSHQMSSCGNYANVAPRRMSKGCQISGTDIEQTPGEITRLRACINDLISVLALPAIWSGHEPSLIASTLLDALLGMLRLDFAYLRLKPITGGAPIEMVRLARQRTVATHAQEVGRALDAWLAADPPTSPFVVPNPVGQGKVSIALLRLGLQDEVGVLVAGAQRPNFPSDVELVLLRVAANQAGIGLQEARRTADQNRAAQELELGVVERTRQLTAVNEELRRGLEALREAQAELAHVTRVTTLGEVTASFAHELNQPLAAIVNNANACLGLLPNRRPDLDEVRDALADIVSDAERASAIIERVRRLAKRSAPERVPLQLVDVVDDVVALAAPESLARRVAIRTDVRADLPVVLGDRVQLQQVLLNLVVNGMDAMSTVDEPERRLEIRGRPDTHDGAQAVTISVQDRGVGLDPGKMERLFEAFYTTKPHGMGMGLAISRSIIEAHGGRLWAEPNRGAGATFSFRVPAAAAHRAAS